jgi:hypothetical protein
VTGPISPDRDPDSGRHDLMGIEQWLLPHQGSTARPAKVRAKKGLELCVRPFLCVLISMNVLKRQAVLVRFEWS